MGEMEEPSGNTVYTLPSQLRDEEKIISWVGQVTNQPADTVRSRLWNEYKQPGVNVSKALAEKGLIAHVFNDAMADFYSSTDSFVYELIIWNRNRLKRRIRRWMAKYLNQYSKQPLDILITGDGLGFDSVYLAQLGHRVSYFELPGMVQDFAKKLFAEYDEDITVLSQPEDIPTAKFDVVVCLDVLEHVPDPNDFVKRIVGYLKPAGMLICHAPFYMVHPMHPTHLKANRRFSGSLSLYESNGLCLTDGKGGFNPLVLQKGAKPKSPSFRVMIIRLAALYWSLGRFTTLPFQWIDSYRTKKNLWFE